MRILFLGDIVGPPGVDFLKKNLTKIQTAWQIDLTIGNAENATNGSGINPSTFKALRLAGLDAVTLGDHVYKKQEIISVLEKDDRICKPANFPPESPGREFLIVPAKDETPVGIFCLLGRTFMRAVDCPFHAADRVLQSLSGPVKTVVVDFHAEATADKYLLAHHLKGRVSAVLGTHTHVQTADEQILEPGTAFICDVGMTGPYESILGRRIDRVLNTTVTFVPSQFEVAANNPRLGGAIVDIDSSTGKANKIQRVLIGEKDLENLPKK